MPLASRTVDLRLYMRVAWRFRAIVLPGIVLALALAFLSFVRVGFAHGKPSLAFRQQQQWVSYTTLFVTQRGFPWGRSIIDTSSGSPTTSADTGSADQQFADPGRFASLAILYSQLATSDPVRQIMLRHGPVTGTVEADAILSRTGLSDALPLVQIAAIDAKPGQSLALAHRVTDAFRTFIEQQQEANAIPPKQRVIVTVLNAPLKPKLLAGRSLTVPIVVFMSVLIVVLGVALILENVRPRVQAVPSEGPEAASASDALRRTA